MKSFINKILNVFKNKKNKDFQFENIYKVCQSSPRDIGEYCRLEGLSK